MSPGESHKFMSQREQARAARGGCSLRPLEVRPWVRPQGGCSLGSALCSLVSGVPSALLLLFEATSRGVFVLYFAACVLCRLPASQFSNSSHLLISNHASGVVARPRFLFKSCLREGRIQLHDLLRRLGRMFALFFCPRDEFLAA